MTTTTIRVSDPREILAYLPFRLGFRPRESAVFVSVRGPRGSLGLVARTDLAELAGPGSGAAGARSLANHVWRDGAEQAVVVIYADGARPGGRWRTDVYDVALRSMAALEDLVGPTATWVVDEERYYRLDCEDASCCPRWGWPLDELDSTQVAAQMVFAGAQVAEHRSDVARIAPAVSTARYNVQRVARRWARRGTEAALDETGAALVAWRSGSLEAWTALVDRVEAGEPTRSRDIGRVGAALQDTIARDAVIMACVTSAAQACEAIKRPVDEASRRIGQTFDVLFEEGGPAPTAQQLAPVREALREIVAHTTGSDQVPALTILAMLAWWQGEGATANCWLDLALDLEPGYRLAGLLAATLEGGLPPGWARSSPAAGPALR